MRLTTHQPSLSPRSAERLPRARMVAVASLPVLIALVFAVDRLTDIPGAQHLYYFPIALAAMRLGMPGGVGAAALAIVLYHLANPHMLTWRYGESDILQMAVFVAAGLVAAKLADDAHRLHQLAMTDDLTGLHNLRSFELELRNMVRDARHRRTPVSVLVLDVDHLKSLNDQHGHIAGAEAVRTVGHLIARNIPADAIGCRYGGDEFVVALPDCPVSEARRIAENLRRAVRVSAPALAGLQFPEGTLSISIGLACRSFDGPVTAAGSGDEQEGDTLFRSADAALYVAKNSGRDRVSLA